MATKIKRALLVILCLILASCAAPPSPSLRTFGDQRAWILLEDMDYVIGRTDTPIVVPRGFVTDFASIPQAFWSLGLTPHGKYGRAAIVHDYLYWSQGCTRDQADRLMVIAMKESNVGWFDENAIYLGVHNGGKSAWEGNAKERLAGLPRIVPESYLRPEDPNMNWPEYRKILVANQVKDPPFAENPPYCKYGNSKEVP